MDEDTPLNVAAAGVLDNDTDVDGDALTVEIKGKSFDLSTVHSAMTEAVHQRQEHLRETLSQARTALR